MAEETAPRQSALARITTETTLRAMSLVRTGEIYDLGSTLSMKMPHASSDTTFAPFRLVRYRSAKDAVWDGSFHGTSFSNEVISGTPHVGTHLDALCHVQFGGEIFGGATAATAERNFGWDSHGIETVKPIITRGIMLDIARDRGVERLAADVVIEQPEIEAALHKRGLAVQQGDAVIVRTGTMQLYGDQKAFEGPQPGLGTDAAIWLHDQGMALLGADNLAVEPQPVRNWERHLHQEMLYHRGVHLLEWVDCESLGSAGVAEFLFICLPLKIAGATGSWVRPVAVV